MANPAAKGMSLVAKNDRPKTTGVKVMSSNAIVPPLQSDSRLAVSAVKRKNKKPYKAHNRCLNGYSFAGDK